VCCRRPFLYLSAVCDIDAFSMTESFRRKMGKGFTDAENNPSGLDVKFTGVKRGRLCPRASGATTVVWSLSISSSSMA
jgi:hypothetical protein